MSDSNSIIRLSDDVIGGASSYESFPNRPDSSSSSDLGQNAAVSRSSIHSIASVGKAHDSHAPKSNSLELGRVDADAHNLSLSSKVNFVLVLIGITILWAEGVLDASFLFILAMAFTYYMWKRYKESETTSSVAGSIIIPKEIRAPSLKNSSSSSNAGKSAFEQMSRKEQQQAERNLFGRDGYYSDDEYENDDDDYVILTDEHDNFIPSKKVPRIDEVD